MNPPRSFRHAVFLLTGLGLLSSDPALLRAAEPAAPATAPTRHPALFLVGDSITKTGTPPGDTGPWGMGYELIPLFDPAKIHVYNEGAGGRSSRAYREEGLWTKVLDRIQPGDFIQIMFGHNDTANSANYPDRATITGNGEEAVQTGVGDKRNVIHTYGWYLREYIKDAKAKGATVIICSPVPRNTWADGKIKRGFDGYAQWAAEAAKAGGALFIDLNQLASDRYDALGEKRTAEYFNDLQHTKKIGARVNAECIAAGLRSLPDCPLAGDLLPPAATIWTLDQTARIGGLVPTVLGAPQVLTEADGKAVHFNGASDGLFIPANPLQGLAQFTIEALIRPGAGGPPEQRFLHVQDEAGSRTLMEIRLHDDAWALDTFLFSEATKSSKPLLDVKRLHPADRWTWVALVYADGHMAHYIDGVKELEGDVNFAPMGAGQISLGVRQNKVYWFKGGIREVRFHPAALTPDQLQRMK